LRIRFLNSQTERERNYLIESTHCYGSEAKVVS
jgi:hypothetical protein